MRAADMPGWSSEMKNKTVDPESISLRPITGEDTEFLYSVYASTRQEEMALTGWSREQIEDFLRMQFQLQHRQYLANYENPSFDIILINDNPAGRLYVDRRKDEMRVIDIALLPEFRRQGAGSFLMRSLMKEADEGSLVMSLHVEFNNPALEYYEKLGFQKRDFTGVYFFMERQPGLQNRKRREVN